MIKIIISGCNGFMGKVLTELCAADEQVTVVAGVDRYTEKLSDYPVYADIFEFTGEADCILDFSSPASMDSLLPYCVEKGVRLVVGTTGHSNEQLAAIKAASEKVGIFKSGNMSLGINLMLELVKKAASVFGVNYDVEIIEKHHRRKVDAPSGTAIMLADAANEALPYDAEYVYERNSVRQPRGDKEIGISSLRGGTIVGEHDVVFAGRDEVLTISHQAFSREVFAVGAVRAGKFMAGITEPGIYDMSDLLSEVLK